MRFSKTLMATTIVCVVPLAAKAGDVTFSGFLSAGGGYVDEDGLSRAGYTEKDFTFDQDSLMGLQASAAVNDKLTITAQLTAEARNDWKTEASWAYVSYRSNDNFTWRFGRLRVPFYLYSDYVTVGYAYPWISPSEEVYSLPFDNISGADALINFSLGKVDAFVQTYTGATDFTANALPGQPDGQSRNQWGLLGQFSYNWAQLRLAHHAAKVSIAADGIAIPLPVPSLDSFGEFATYLTSLGFARNAERLLIVEDNYTFDDIALSVDTGRFIAVYEKSELSSADESPIADTIRSYLTLGVRFGDVLLHVTQGVRDDESADLSQGIPANTAVPGLGNTNTIIAVLDGVAENQRNESVANTIGLRWDFTNSATFKLEYTKQDDKTAEENDVKLIRFAVQTVF